jgi:hypothetical protein
MKIRDDRMALGHTVGRIYLRGDAPRQWLDGTVLTKHGIVDVQAEPVKKWSRFDFVWRGVLHMRTFEGGAATKRGLARVAATFAAAVAEGK